MSLLQPKCRRPIDVDDYETVACGTCYACRLFQERGKPAYKAAERRALRESMRYGADADLKLPMHDAAAAFRRAELRARTNARVAAERCK